MKSRQDDENIRSTRPGKPASLRSIQVHSEHDPNAQFPFHGSFAILSAPDRIQEDARVNRTRLEDRIQKAITKEMRAKGLVETVGKKPDLYIGFAVLLAAPVEASVLNLKLGRLGEWQPEPEDGKDYEKGSLIIDIIDGRSDDIIWRGVAKAEIIVSSTQEERKARVQHAIHEILNLYPPASPAR